MTMTQPDLTYALSIVNQYFVNPNSSYIPAIIQIWRSICGTLPYGFTYTKSHLGFVSYTIAY